MSKETNGMVIRALCTDIDGTLLNSERELSVTTIGVIAQIRDSIPVVLASSRMPSAMRHLQQQLGILQHPMICYNGGYILQYDKMGHPCVIYSAFIATDIVEEILKMTTNTSLHVSLYYEDNWYAPKMDEWTSREATITKVCPHLKAGDEVLRDWRHAQQGAHKVMIMGEASEIKPLESALRAKFETVIHVYHSKSTYLEIAPKVISKASALRLLLDNLYDIPLSQVIAFGDNYNDMEMLESVGLGIAVGNAREEVKAVAKEITTAGKEDGVALAIYKHLLKSNS